MKLLFIAVLLTLSQGSHAKLELKKEIKHGPIIRDSCGNFEDGVKALERLQDTSDFEHDGNIAIYNFSARAMAALYKQKMLTERNKAKRDYYRDQYLLACRNAG